MVKILLCYLSFVSSIGLANKNRVKIEFKEIKPYSEVLTKEGIWVFSVDM